jgi:hypothetical protein
MDLTAYHEHREHLVQLEEAYYPLEDKCHRLFMQIVHDRQTLTALEAKPFKTKFETMAVVFTTKQMVTLGATYAELQAKCSDMWDQVERARTNMINARNRVYASRAVAVHPSVVIPATPTTTATSLPTVAATSTSPRRRRVDSTDESTFPAQATTRATTDMIHCTRCGPQPSDMFSDRERTRSSPTCLKHAKTYARAYDAPQPYVSDSGSEAEEVDDDEEEILRRDKRDVGRRTKRLRR